MQRLSSCYFCGVALDESLSEYPVVPDRLDPDENDQRTVVLCSTCRRKLGTILDTVVSAAQADAPTESAPADDTATSEESGMDAHPDPMALSDANETVAEDYPDRDILDRVDGDEADAVSADGTATEERDDEEVDSDEQSTDEAVGPEDGGHDETGHDEGDSDETGNEPASEEDAGEAETEEPDPALTRLEYSKVMRLLQNRPFPVDKAEMRQVAVNAYDIDPDQFDAITDLAIERDLIAEKGGQFVSPE